MLTRLDQDPRNGDQLQKEKHKNHELPLGFKDKITELEPFFFCLRFLNLGAKVRILPKAKRDYIIDDRPSQRKKGHALRQLHCRLEKGPVDMMPNLCVV